MDAVVKEKYEQFSAKIIQIYRHLFNDKKKTVLSEMLLRSGTSIGANLAKADFSASKSEYITKVYTALQDAAETKYWLDLLNQTETITEFEYKSIIDGCEEMEKILLAMIKTLRAQVAQSK
jgi:four helix bundle protein